VSGADGIAVPAERILPAGEVRLHALDWGGEGPDVLFLHGGALNAHSWDSVCLALGRECRRVAVDLRGHGDSEWAPDGDYDYQAYERDVLAALDALALRRPLIVGQSLGGLVTLRIAADRPTALSAAVLVDIGPDVREAGRSRIREFVNGDRAIGTLEEFMERAGRFRGARDPELLRRSLLLNLRSTEDGRFTWKWDPRQFTPERRSRRDAERRGLWALVSRISVPVLVVRGGRSDIFLDDDARKLAGALANAHLVVLDRAGHNVQSDDPSGLAAAVRTFALEMATQE
jgi:pimeloyl-ACP methyl ester carboxylesterase